MPSNLKVIAIGSSAGGLNAIKELLEHLPLLDDVCLVIAQHVSPDHTSRLAELLQKTTSYQVVEAKNQQELEAGKVYVTPPNRHCQIQNTEIILSPVEGQIGPKPSVDMLFGSLAQQSFSHKIGIILSGTGSDGAQGTLALKDKGGIILVQDTNEAKYSGMPLATLQTGSVDAELHLAEMGSYLQKLFAKVKNTEGQDEIFQKIIGRLDEYSETDFAQYKRASVQRRLNKRMNETGYQSLHEYYDYLNEKPAEAKKLYESILIGVTSFFRDKEAFELLRKELSDLISQKKEKDPIRIWVPGCSSGEEVYTIAIIASEICKGQKKLDHLQIFGSDIDERAVFAARKGKYRAESIKGLAPDLLKKYFKKEGDYYQVNKDLRSRILFSRHDLLNHAPYLKQDMVSCRNLLIYFDNKLQKEVIPIFHYALNNGGLLFLGRSESIGGFAKLFKPLDTKNKIYRRRSGGDYKHTSLPALSPQKSFQKNLANLQSPPKTITLQDRIKETLFSSFEHPYIVINEFFELIETQGDLRKYISIPSGSVDLNILNLILPELKIEMRAILTRAVKNNQAANSSIRPVHIDEDDFFLRFGIKPLTYQRDQGSLFLVIIEELKFDDKLTINTRDNALEISSDAYREMEWELANTKENLQNYIEEIETSNEELQALNEELQSLNEEMQSTNQELETTNEELQSTTEEAQMAYTELQIAHTELEENEDLLKENQAQAEALLNNELQAFLLLDDQKRILKFNHRAAETFKDLYNVTLIVGELLFKHLPQNQKNSFAKHFNAALSGEAYAGEQSLKAINGKEKFYRLSYSPVKVDDINVTAVSVGMLDITLLKEMVRKLSDSEKLVHSVFDTVNIGLCITNEQGYFIRVNEAYCQIYGYSPEELVGEHFTLVVPSSLKAEMNRQYAASFSGKVEIPFEAESENKQGELIWVASSAQRLVLDDDRKFKITSIQNITERKELEAQRQALRDGLPGVTWQYRLYPDGTEKLTGVSEGASKMWGVSPEDVMADANNVWQVIHRDDVEGFGKAVQYSAENMSTLQYEYRVVLPHDKTRWLRVSSNPKTLADGSIIWSSIAIDVTAEKEAIDELKDSEQKLTQAAAIANLGYWEIDGDNDGALTWSDQHYKIWGTTAEKWDHTLEAFLNTVYPEDLKAVKKDLDKLFHHHVDFDLRYRVVINGEIKWVHSKGIEDPDNPKFYHGTVQEITVQKEEEERRKLLESVVTNIGDPVMITEAWPQSDPGPVILYVNQAFTDMTGYTAEEAVGQSPRFLQGPKSDFKDLKKMGEAMRKWQAYETTTINYKKNGEEFWNNFKIYPVENEKGEYTHWISIDHDVTAFKKRQRQQQLLSEIGYLFDEKPQLLNVLQAIVKKLVEEESFDVAEIWLADHSLQKMDLQAFYHAKPEFEAFHGAKKDHSMARDIGLTGYIWDTQKAVLVRDLPSSDKYHRKEAAKTAGINTAYAIPLMHAKEVVGMLLLGAVSDYENSKPFDLLFNNFKGVLGTEILRKKLEEDINTIYNTVPAIISVSDFDGNIIKINEVGSQLLGYSQEELLSMNWQDLVHPDDRQKTQLENKAHKKGKPTIYSEKRCRTKSGELIWLAWTIKPDLDRGLTFGVAKNIHQEKELKLLLDNANRIARMGAWKLDLEKDELFWSDMANIINEAPPGWTPKSLKENLSYYPAGEDREKVINALDRAQNKGEAFDLEVLKYNFGKKKKKWVRLLGEPQMKDGVCLIINGTIQDIDKRKRAEQLAFSTLEEKEEILESIGDGFYSMDSEFNITYCNQKSLEIFGLPKDKLLNNNLLEVFPETKNSELTQHYLKAMETNEEDRFTFYLERLDVYYDISIFPAQGKGLSIYFKDISERVAYIKEIEQKNARLSEIAWTQSHVVRAPLARIMGLVQLIEAGLANEKETKEFLNDIMKSSKELDDVIRNIVSLTQTLDNRNQ